MATVFIKGLGLIGSSLVRAIRETHPEVTIIASDLNDSSLDYALENKLVDQTTTDLTGVEQADFIILATPVSQIIEDINELAERKLKQNVIVTDVGSTKLTIMEAATKLEQKGICFVGGHPMAGSHKSGVEAGRANLFENAYYFLIPNEQQAGVSELKRLLNGTKVKWLLTDADQHDLIVTQISDLPHVIAATLVNNTEDVFADDPIGMRVAAGGFKSVTQIAASSPQMWSSIMLNNQRLITKHLQGYIDDLKNVQKQVDEGNQEALLKFFTRAKKGRESLKSDGKALYYDLFLNIADRSGEIAQVTKMIADEQISLVNIQILEVREDINGVLQLVFSSRADRERAAVLLKGKYELVSR
jgi:prephenate dehydrogenase